MQQITELVVESDHKAYLAAAEELTRELQRAMTAVRTGALSAFEDSLVRQRIGCARLAELAPMQAAEGVDQVLSLRISNDPLLADRIKSAISDLVMINRRYSKLVKHFRETARVFAGRFRPYGSSARPGSYLDRSHRGWSCEL